MNDITIHPLFGNHAVLQRDCPLPVWGTAEPGEDVTVSFAGQSKLATADRSGKWRVSFDPLPASCQPRELTVRSSRNARSATSENILVGDVFLCSGQSNMEWSLWSSDGGAEAAASADDPCMRILAVPLIPSHEARYELGAGWSECTPVTAPSFSAVAFHGGRALRAAYPDVPVGMIRSAWGGTRIEPWISPAGLQAFPALYAVHRRLGEVCRLAKQDPAEHERRRHAIRDSFERAFKQWHVDLCTADGGEAEGVPSPDYAISDWPTRKIPGFWPDEVMGPHEGVVWFACDVDLPCSWDGQGAALYLGAIDNEDTTWVNGVRVGSIGALDGVEHWCMPREYAIPEGLLHAGSNRIVVRVIVYGGQGGFAGGANGLSLQRSTGDRVALPREWHYRVGSPLVGPRVQYPAGWAGDVDQASPGALFGGMIAPLVPAALAGIWWYQGESNTEEPREYRDLLKALIMDWRRLFRPSSTFDPVPFYWVQLPGYEPVPTEPAASKWALLREAQTMALSLPSTGQAVILDCGNPVDVHPGNKKTPGERLAALVRHGRGDQHIAIAGPRFKGISIEGAQARITFECRGRLRTTDGAAPGHVAIRGATGQWHWAETAIEGDTVLAHSPSVPDPLAVRYAWADNPEAANLTDDTGLPAWPFRTDED